MGRRPPESSHPKLTSHIVDLQAPVALPAIDDVFIALGTTIQAAGSRSAFRAVDCDAVLGIVRSARAAGATRLGLVSAMGADASSRIFYSRVKGEVEQAISQFGFETLVIARPSMLDGDRAALGRPARLTEQWTLRAMRWLRPLIPTNYAPVGVAQVARALVENVGTGMPGRRVMLSGAMQRY